MLRAIVWILKSAKWSVEPDTSKANEPADFVEECMEDMDWSWSDFLSEALTFLPYGWSVLETVYKRRDDGKLGWKRFGLRGQETLQEWKFDPKGYATDMIQSVDYTSKGVVIPLSKCLHFRLTSEKGNPEGEALALDTPIPSPDGWTTMGALLPGDRLFDETGEIRHVVAISQTWTNRPTYRVCFNDDTEIIADANHKWFTTLVWERSKSKSGKLRTTKQIAETVQNANGVSNHAIPWAQPLRYVRQHLLIPPYLFGLWLGDGSSYSSDITCHVDDIDETIVSVEADGYKLTRPPSINGNHGGLGRRIRIAMPFMTHLHSLNVLKNKHIPEQYLRGSIEQRTALLQGLMDSDGCVDQLGRCEFSNTNKKLADGVVELVRSLGCGAVIRSKAERRGISPSWRVKFTPTTFIPFRLSRKQARLNTERARSNHYLVSVEPIEPVATRCIQVDSPSGLFLASRSMIPTHNSILRAAYRPYYFKQNIEDIEGIGVERDLAGLPIAYLGTNTTKSGTNSDYEKIKDVVRNIRRDEQECIVVPHPKLGTGVPGEGVLIELMSSGGSREFQTGAIITRYEQRVAMSVLAQWLMLGMSGVGSYALSQDQSDFFRLGLEGTITTICDQFSKQAIRRLMAVNPSIKGGENLRLVGKLSIAPDYSKFANAINQLIQAQVLNPADPNLQTTVRDVLGLPKPMDGEVFVAEEPEEEIEKGGEGSGFFDHAGRPGEVGGSTSRHLPDRAYIAESRLSKSLSKEVDGFAKRFGIGPCGAYAALLRERGKGDIVVCLAHPADGSAPFTHYAIWKDGIGLIDRANQTGRRLEYTDMEILPPYELPELIGPEEIGWLRQRGVK
ncbi:MAG: hypothetical protein M0R06_00985 [Sphaerochaeta sp.]|jgi:hypothetical protein|nr:hypothetical protein [Sphaerochaeta sp.]